MNSLFIKNLYIFEYQTKLAKHVNFKDGINIITSDKEKGNSVGKSSILRSIYHALGADGRFGDEWKNNTKSYLVEIEINNIVYQIYRRDSLFKVFDKDFKKLFLTSNRQDLAVYLSDIFKIKVLLQNKQTKELEVSPPAYMYLLNYIDQDRMDGANFTAFNSLTQYSDYRSTLLYSHFGVFNDEYYKAQEDIQYLKSMIKKKESERALLNQMKDKISTYLNGYNAPSNFDILNIDLDENDTEYEQIITKMQKIKNRLIELRNIKLDLQLSIKDIIKIEKEWQENLFDNKSDIDIKLERMSTLEDLIIEKDELDNEIANCNRNIIKYENQYKDILDILKKYENKMKLNESNISNILKYKGYKNTRDELVSELGSIKEIVKQYKDNIEEKQNIINSYLSKKKEITPKYFELMKESRDYFGLKEIHESSMKSIKKQFKGDGGNLPASTIFWHINLLKLKDEFNPDALRFPLIIDSPNNRETEDDKKIKTFRYIFDNLANGTQLIISTLGFNKENFKDIEFNNIIELNNEKYSLLNKEDYEKNKHLLKVLIEK